ncbi:hypothetical protein [Propionivibrio sp.]|uniref:hypothetical protein n=1 Tax=Propionivibrio sp. TaxID=2212460 RepID=UPI003BF3AF73
MTCEQGFDDTTNFLPVSQLAGRMKRVLSADSGAGLAQQFAKFHLFGGEHFRHVTRQGRKYARPCMKLEWSLLQSFISVKNAILVLFFFGGMISP